MQKGVDLIADVFPTLLAENPLVQLICIGTRPMGKTLACFRHMLTSLFFYPQVQSSIFTANSQL